METEDRDALDSLIGELLDSGTSPPEKEKRRIGLGLSADAPSDSLEALIASNFGITSGTASGMLTG